MKETITYYDHNADSYVSGTVHADMSAQYALFQKYCKAGSRILDFGCGSGRDVKYYLEQGYQVSACDGSAELCKIASAYAGIPVDHLYFHQLEAVEAFDGIWACSSILHASREELPDIFLRIRNALVSGGYLYTSFKYGDFSGDRQGRYFSDFTEASIRALLAQVTGLELVETAITEDVRPDHPHEKWLNLIIRKSL